MGKRFDLNGSAPVITKSEALPLFSNLPRPKHSGSNKTFPTKALPSCRWDSGEALPFLRPPIKAAKVVFNEALPLRGRLLKRR